MKRTGVGIPQVISLKRMHPRTSNEELRSAGGYMTKSVTVRGILNRDMDCWGTGAVVLLLALVCLAGCTHVGLGAGQNRSPAKRACAARARASEESRRARTAELRDARCSGHGASQRNPRRPSKWCRGASTRATASCADSTQFAGDAATSSTRLACAASGTLVATWQKSKKKRGKTGAVADCEPRCRVTRVTAASGTGSGRVVCLEG